MEKARGPVLGIGKLASKGEVKLATSLLVLACILQRVFIATLSGYIASINLPVHHRLSPR